MRASSCKISWDHVRTAMQFNFSGAIIIRDKWQNIDEYCFAFESRRRRSYVEDSPCATRHTYRSNKASQESARKCNVNAPRLPPLGAKRGSALVGGTLGRPKRTPRANAPARPAAGCGSRPAFHTRAVDIRGTREYAEYSRVRALSPMVDSGRLRMVPVLAWDPRPTWEHPTRLAPPSAADHLAVSRLLH